MSTQEKVLIVEDEENERTGLAELISAWGYRTETAKDGLEGLEKSATWFPGIVVTDFKMPRMDGMELLQRLSDQPQPVAVVLLTAQGSIDVAVDAMKSGAYDFIQKPVDPTRLRQILQNAARQRGTSLELEATRRKLRDSGLFGHMVGGSKSMQEIFHLVEMVAPSTASVLITGESGTGKEMVARTIHDMSPRKSKPFVAINCSAIPETLIESEIFGHEKGAFTGAIAQKIGRLELAHQGTLFLDEIGDLPLELQPKILRALQEKEFERLGGTRTIPSDARLVAATNRNLEQMVAERQFRSDLYYRLKVFPITIPALRERREDIPVLARHFVEKHARRMNKCIEAIPSDAMRVLEKWDWPGNIRELENFIERAVILSSGPALRAPLGELERLTAELPPPPADGTLEATEREHILRVLRESKGVIAGTNGAAARLGLKRTTLNSKMKKLDIKREDYI